mgnify:CR=1 FL=1
MPPKKVKPMDKLAKQLRDDAEQINVSVSDELDHRIAASLRAVTPVEESKRTPVVRPPLFWWASTITGVAAALAVIEENHPDHAVLAEESDDPVEEQLERWDGRPMWIVDPLDGTANRLGPPPVLAVGYGDMEEQGSLEFEHFAMVVWFAHNICAAASAGKVPGGEGDDISVFSG